MNKRTISILLALALAFLVGLPGALAFPQYLTAFQQVYTDGSCGTCHVDPAGGGDRNTYGTMFENQPNHATDPVAALQAIGPAPGTSPLATATATVTTPTATGTPNVTVTALTPTTPIVTGPQLVLTLNASSSGSMVSNFTSAVLLDKTGAIVESASSISADGLTTTFNLTGIMPDFYFIEVNGLSGDRVPTFIDNNATNISQLVTKGLTTTTVGDATNPAKYRIKARSGGRHPIVNYFTGENETGLPFVIVYNDTSPGKIEVREVNTSRLLTSFTPSSLSDTIHASLEAGVTFQSWQLNLGASLPGFTGLLNHGQIYNNTDSLCNGCHGTNMNTKPINYSDVGTSFASGANSGGSGWCFKCHYGGTNGGDTNGFVDPTVIVAANGTIAGNVTNASNGSAISGATVTADGMMATTDANGIYSISIAAGTYNMTANATGYQTNTTTGVVVTAGNVTTQDFALTPLVTQLKQTFNISGFKINDTNGNGVWDFGEMGIENWNIMLLNNTGVQLANISTNASGFYQFMSIFPGNYSVAEETKAGFNSTNATSMPVTVENMDVTNVNFTNQPVAPTATPTVTPKKVTICHIPPGNPENRQTITVDESAVQAHLKHGDTLGPCVTPTPTPTIIPTITPTITATPTAQNLLIQSAQQQIQSAQQLIQIASQLIQIALQQIQNAQQQIQMAQQLQNASSGT
jgi:hypothetical protein